MGLLYFNTNLYVKFKTYIYNTKKAAYLATYYA